MPMGYEIDHEKFDRDQLEQIELGRRDGVDVSVYAHKEYLAIQMYWIRKGLMCGIDVSRYSDPSFDWFQMEEIYKGLQSGVDISKYAFKEVSYDRMRYIREGLEVGLDLSLFTKYGALELKELLEALKKKINIVSYMLNGYVAEQLHEICIAKEKGLDIDPYITNEFRGVAIHEIIVGLENNVDVSCYAKICYSWQQMREIREGLENQIDVNMYISPYYSAMQMREIRMGLEAGLDVSKYRSFMYSINDMCAIRKELLNQKTGGSDIPPVPGEDGYYEFLFDTEADGKLVFLEDGSIDYRNSRKVIIAQANTPIAVYHPATEGTDGLTVDGKPIKAARGKEKKILSGKGLYYNRTENQYYATVEGRICLDENNSHLDIIKTKIFDEVSSLEGTVEFDGGIFIKGNVESGSKIIATGDVIVDGHIENSNIKCGGNLFAGKGINCKESGCIEAGGNIESLYIESAKVRACHDIYTRYCLKSHVRAEGEVYIKGGKASIIGGEVSSAKGIYCTNLGNEYGTETQVILSLSKEKQPE